MNFQLTMPSSLRLLEKLHRVLQADVKIYFLSWYLLELALVEYKFAKYKICNIACSALYLSMKINKKKECWSETLTYLSNYSENDVKPVAKELCLLLTNA